jgi:tetratricopeptide (TPR) repeat protein
MFWRWNWAETENEFLQAIDLSPRYATARQWYANCLTASGRLSEAETFIREARDLDPLSLPVNADLTQILHFARKYDDAIEQCRKTLELDPNFGFAYIYLSQAYTQKGMYEEARDEYVKGLKALVVS